MRDETLSRFPPECLEQYRVGTCVLTLLMTGIPGQKDKWLKNSTSHSAMPISQASFPALCEVSAGTLAVSF